jgi:hypothetical protein
VILFAQQKPTLSLNFIFDIHLYMFRTVLQTIINSLNNVFTAIGVCYTPYVDYLLARSGLISKMKLRNSVPCWLILYEYITMHDPQNVKIVVMSLHLLPQLINSLKLICQN